MPKTSGAVLDWVPQKAAQQMQSEATTRFMPVLASPLPLRAGGFRSPAHVPGAEQELLHREGVRDCGEIVPRLDEGIAEHGALHQPEAEGQNQLAAQPGRKLAVHDDDASARTQLLPCVVQHRKVVRHGIVAKAE
jgi:hypothetical protein